MVGAKPGPPSPPEQARGPGSAGAYCGRPMSGAAVKDFKSVLLMGSEGRSGSQLPLGTEQNLTWEALRFSSSTEFQDSPDDPGECGIKKIQM